MQADDPFSWTKRLKKSIRNPLKYDIPLGLCATLYLHMTSFHFKASEYYHRHKGADWYLALSIIAVAATITAIIFGNVLLAIIIVLGAFSLAMYASRPPEENDVEISETFVTVGKYRFSYSNMESFWIEHSEKPRLLIKTNRIVMPHLIIPLDTLSDGEKNEIREFLKTKLREEEQSEPLFEQIMEYVGF